MQYTPFPIQAHVLTGLVISSIVVFFNLLIVGLRFTARLVAGSRLGWDDYLMLAALPQGIVMLVLLGFWAPSGFSYPWTEAQMNSTYIFTVRLALSPYYPLGRF